MSSIVNTAALATLTLAAASLSARWLWRQRGIPRNAKRVVVIVGASRGIGRVVAQCYAQNTSVVGLCLFSRQAAQLDRLKNELSGSRASVETVAGDVNSMEDVKRLVQHATQLCQRHQDAHLTVILNAGTICGLQLSEMPEFDATLMRQVVDTNLLAPMVLSRAFLPLLREHCGTLAFVSSVAGRFGAPTRSLYAASKHGLMGFADSIRMELEQYGISVVSVCPATVQTGLRLSAVELQNTPDGARIVQPEEADGMGMSVDVCAQAVVRAIDRQEREVWIPASYRLLDILRLIWPGAVDHLAKQKYKQMLAAAQHDRQ